MEIIFNNNWRELSVEEALCCNIAVECLNCDNNVFALFKKEDKILYTCTRCGRSYYKK